MPCMDTLMEGLYRRPGGYGKLTSVAGYVVIFSWSCSTVVGPGLAQSSRSHYHLSRGLSCSAGSFCYYPGHNRNLLSVTA